MCCETIHMIPRKKSTVAINYEDEDFEEDEHFEEDEQNLEEEEEDVESSDSDDIVLQDLSDEDSSGPDEDISDHNSSDLEEPLRKQVQLKSGGVTTTMAL